MTHVVAGLPVATQFTWWVALVAAGAGLVCGIALRRVMNARRGGSPSVAGRKPGGGARAPRGGRRRRPKRR